MRSLDVQGPEKRWLMVTVVVGIGWGCRKILDFFDNRAA
jgi:hypothetical protein